MCGKLKFGGLPSRVEFAGFVVPSIEALDHVLCALRRNEDRRVRNIVDLDRRSRHAVNGSGGRIEFWGAFDEIWGGRMVDSRQSIFLAGINKHIGVPRREDVAIVTKSNR